MAAEELNSDRPPPSPPPTKARRDYDKKDPPCRNTIIAIRCLRICFFVILAMEAIIVVTALSRDREPAFRNEYTGVPEAVLIVMFLMLLPTTYGLRQKNVFAWFMAILELALCMCSSDSPDFPVRACAACWSCSCLSASSES